MKALVISGGGSKGAFAGGVAQFLIEEVKRDYDIFVGTSTGSLLLSHLALSKVDKIKEIYSNVKITAYTIYCEDVVCEHHFLCN